jgi:hypothetical protein
MGFSWQDHARADRFVIDGVAPHGAELSRWRQDYAATFASTAAAITASCGPDGTAAEPTQRMAAIWHAPAVDPAALDLAELRREVLRLQAAEAGVVKSNVGMSPRSLPNH